MVVGPISGRIAVVGTGVIGTSWAAYFLAKGFDVAATDPADGAEKRLRTLVDGFWPTLERIGLAEGAPRSRLRFDSDIARAVEGCAFVQESGPERVDVKRDLLARISAAVPADSLIATSSSGILISDIQDAAAHPERVLLGHPFNPVHLIPLVEVVGGRLTSEDTIRNALAFYSSIGKKPIRIRREVQGHVANRLQAALWREAFYLVQRGIVSVEDVDTAIAHGPGLRWALLGPFLNMHLSGGAGGIAHVLEGWWRDLGSVTLNGKLNAAVARGVAEELGGVDPGRVAGRRDQLLLALLQLKAGGDRLP
jgi:carnitine 3-dehydrogenase